MKGSVLMGGTLIIAAAMGFGIWYTANLAYYHEVDDVTEVALNGVMQPVSDYRGIDADTSPLKIRGCFKVDWDYVAEPGNKGVAEPLIAPSWFDCFDARRISDDLQADRASARLSRSNEPYGFDTYIAQYPDGRAYLWRQLNDCGTAVFNGKDVPAGCPAPPKKY